MDGSDDYLFDDLVLDQQTIDALDSEEQKYLTQVTLSQPPPAKRQKTDNGWRPVAAPARAPVLNDEDLPEISVHGDGTYAFRGAARSTANPTIVPPRRTFNANSVQSPHHRVVSAPVATVHATHTRPDPLPRPPQQQRTRPSLNPPDVAQAQAEDLRKQIEELRRENEKYKVELKDATDSKYAKQGEVAILRKNIEKVSQEHTAQLTRLKLAKEESEAKQIALQKEMKAEMERMKSQFIFKQQEIEGSSRKPPMSVRSKRMGKDVPTTPMAPPSQMRGWNSTSAFPEQSPARARAGKGGGDHSHRTPEKPRKQTKLFGFQNAFADETPLRPSQSRPAKEDDTFARPARGLSPIPFPRQQFADIQTVDPPNFTQQPIDFAQQAVAPEPTEPDVQMPDEFDDIEPFNWKAELTRLVLTHTSSSDTSPTFKNLVGLGICADYAEQYSNAVTRTLELVASTSQQKVYEASLAHLCHHFTLMVKILHETDMTSPMASLLNLITCLSCSLPVFTPCLLLQEDTVDHIDILELLSAIICHHLRPNKQPPPDSQLANETVGLLEALCWNVKDDLALRRLSVVCNNKDALLILLDTAQPSWLLERTTRLLAFLAAHPTLCPQLLSSPENAPPSEGKTRDGTSKLPLIERLCSFLTDRSRNGSSEVRIWNILSFFTILSVAHTEVHATLVGCQGVVPSLVVLLTQLTTLLWDDDEFCMSQSDTLNKIVQTVNQTVLLFHHLVFGLKPHINLRQRLHYAPARTFNGVLHMFIVTFGRLSHAEHPDWIDPTHKLEIGAVTGLARELLDEVVDGPEEAEGIWAAYNIDDSDTDEEMEEAILQAGVNDY
ncbi:hypothetical protein FB45DRAFT_733467 [Roridomyces roridus]|uniref:Rad26 atrip n=1 Tax=Roridomyces roridus TaxID=1738132 RepID=A0AAD7CHA1_9AGAR|nr:hypothetical protein FB45DRAFT_733467 [Roridomyces roridus]